MPDILASTGKAEGLEAHRLQRHVPGQDHQIGPANLVAILLFDRPQQSARLVEVDVIRPAVERGKTLTAGATTTTAIGGTVGAGAMPRHPNHQATVMTPVRGPPALAV